MLERMVAFVHVRVAWAVCGRVCDEIFEVALITSTLLGSIAELFLGLPAISGSGVADKIAVRRVVAGTSTRWVVV